MPEVSIVLPVFNSASTLARAVASILDQTLRNIELIVVDDGSTDETPQVLRQFTDTRMRVIRSTHRNVADATNAATGVAQSPLIARMDADDFSYPQRIEKQCHFLNTHHLDAVGCQVRIVDDTGHPSPSMRRYQKWINDETADGTTIESLRFVELPLVNPTILARRHYFDLGFRMGDFPEDYDLLLRAANRGMQFGKLNEVLFDWTDGPNRLTRTDSRYSPEAFNRCRKIHLLQGPFRDVKCVDLWGVGETGKPWLRWLLDQGVTVRWGYDVNQRKVGELIHGVRIKAPTQMPPADGTLLFIAVGAFGARELITDHLRSRGYVLGADAWFVA